jgi:Transcriptional regulatory protein, C terminal
MSNEPTEAPIPVNVDALDFGPVFASLVELKEASALAATHPMPDDVLALKDAAGRAAMKFVMIVPGTDWNGIGPVPAMGGTPDRMSAVHGLFRLLQACYALHPYQQMPAPAWIAAKVGTVLAKLRPAAHDGQQGDDPGIEGPQLEQVRKVGPFGITLDFKERKATRAGVSADFGSKEYPWKVFELLFRSYPARLSPDSLVDSVWGKGEGSRETLQVHMTKVRNIIKLLDLTVECIAGVGYKLAESTPTSQGLRP